MIALLNVLLVGVYNVNNFTKGNNTSMKSFVASYISGWFMYLIQSLSKEKYNHLIIFMGIQYPDSFREWYH